MAQLMTLRIDDDLKEQFLEVAKSMNQNQSDALAQHIKRTRFKAIHEAAERMNNNPSVQADNQDAMNEMAAYWAVSDAD